MIVNLEWFKGMVPPLISAETAYLSAQIFNQYAMKAWDLSMSSMITYDCPA